MRWPKAEIATHPLSPNFYCTVDTVLYCTVIIYKYCTVYNLNPVTDRH